MRARFRCSLLTGLPGSLWMLLARLAWLAITTLTTTSCAEDAYFDFRYLDNAHCGKKFRIATHVSPPYIMIQDWSKCVDQKCGPEAFGNNGGVVYKLMMEHILPQLRTYCKVIDVLCKSIDLSHAIMIHRSIFFLLYSSCAFFLRTTDQDKPRGKG